MSKEDAEVAGAFLVPEDFQLKLHAALVKALGKAAKSAKEESLSLPLLSNAPLLSFRKDGGVRARKEDKDDDAGDGPRRFML